MHIEPIKGAKNKPNSPHCEKAPIEAQINAREKAPMIAKDIANFPDFHDFDDGVCVDFSFNRRLFAMGALWFGLGAFYGFNMLPSP